MCDSKECCGDCNKCLESKGYRVKTPEELDYIFGTMAKMRNENSKEYQDTKRSFWKVIKGNKN